MDPATFLTASAVVIVAGKGGVGKTTVAAALGHAAAGLGLDTLLIETEGKRGLSELFGAGPLTYEEQSLGDRLSGRSLTSQHALSDYLEQRGFTRMLKRFQGHRVLDALAAATPGIRDLLVLGKIKQIANHDEHDLVIVDVPAAGHAISFLRSAQGVLDTVSAGPIREQALEVTAMLTDPARSQVLLVTLAEETPVNEIIDTAFALEDEIGVKLGPIVVNQTRPALGTPVPHLAEAAEAAGVELSADQQATLQAATEFRIRRDELQSEQLQRLSAELPLQQILLPFLATPTIGRSGLDRLAAALVAGIESIQPTPTASRT